jgi:hypothetical protein
MQENELRPLLTAREAMTYAAKLKLGGGSHSPSNKAIGLQVRQNFLLRGNKFWQRGHTNLDKFQNCMQLEN